MTEKKDTAKVETGKTGESKDQDPKETKGADGINPAGPDNPVPGAAPVEPAPPGASGEGTAQDPQEIDLDTASDAPRRAVGPLKEPKEGEESAAAPDRAALRQMMKEGEKVEVVFSDGENEILGMPPLDVGPGQMWLDVPAGLVLQRDVRLTGGQAAVELHGYGLFIDGEQVAYGPRNLPLRIHPGGTFDLTNDIVFPG